MSAPRPAVPRPPLVIGHRSLSIPRGRRGGFALLITITLLAFLVLLLVSLASLTRVETQVASNSQHLAQARQNALMALNIAIGQLQKHTGPDQRITAPADLHHVSIGSTNDPVSAVDLDSGTPETINNSIDAYWRASRNRRWVGVWRDPDPKRTTLAPDTPAATPVTPQFLTWLVSGTELPAATFTPQSPVTNMTLEGVTDSGAPTAVFGTAAQPYRMLVGTGTTSVETNSDIDRAVLVPEVPITSTAVQGLTGIQTIGHYAWWVGDEGIKARADTIDPFAGSSDPEENRTRLQSAQRSAIEAMTDLAALYPANNDQLTKVVSHNQLLQAGDDPDFGPELKKRYHDITVHSRGVLSDTRNGGLKADLSWLLGQPSDTVYRDQLRALYDDTTLSTDSSILSNTATPYVSPLGANSFVGNYALGLSRSATWDQLRAYFNMGNLPDDPVPGVIDSSAKAVSRTQSKTTQGIGPLLVHAKLFYGLQIDASGSISVQIRPLVVLANPYDIVLTGDYYVRFDGPGVSVRTNQFDAGNPLPATPTAAAFPSTGAVSVNNGRLNLVIPDSAIPPGEARVYTLKQDYSDTGSGALQQIEMSEGYDPGPVFTLTGVKSLGTDTHAVLYASKIVPSARLYGADPATNVGVDDNLFQFIYPYQLKLPGTPSSDIFLVYPTTKGETRPGGGGWFVITDSLVSPARRSQQANFVQFNPRTLASFYTGNTSKTHPLENSQTYFRNGEPGNDAWFTTDLMFDLASGDLVRWGPVTKADNANPLAGLPPAGVGADTGYTNILYSIPRPERRLSSIAQLQHFSPSGFINNGRFGNTKDEQFATQANTFQLNYPIGNSYPNPRVPRDRAYFANSSNQGSTNMGTVFDGSWLNNEALADRFFFSTYPADGAYDFADANLINQGIRPFRNRSDIAWSKPSHFRGAARTAATNLMVNGAFNINSTSVEAWKAVLSSLRNVPVEGDASVNVPFTRGLYQTKGYTGARTANTAAAWAGFHNLSDTEIGNLAQAIVLQIRRRGPFLSLADFMNRRLVDAPNDPMNLGRSGAVQAAIDAVLNQVSDVDTVFHVQSHSNNFADSTYLMPTMTAGAPGYVLQADLLSPVASTLSPRSDTFIIRTYGDVENPATGEITARAWCEAVVQRTPDYVVQSPGSGNSPDELPTAGTDNETFGRRYEIVSFRWLTAQDI